MMLSGVGAVCDVDVVCHVQWCVICSHCYVVAVFVVMLVSVVVVVVGVMVEVVTDAVLM